MLLTIYRYSCTPVIKCGLAAMLLLLFAACGGGNNNNNNNNPPPVNIFITPTLNAPVGTTNTLQVTRQNTDDFALSVSPTSGSGCIKSGNNAVVCTPTEAGTYTITVTAAADTSKKATATVVVSEGVTISILPATAGVIVGESETFTVTTENTDFALSVSPASGSGCIKSGSNAVVCTPTEAGKYDITVTATGDAAKKAVSVMTVDAATQITSEWDNSNWHQDGVKNSLIWQ